MRFQRGAILLSINTHVKDAEYAKGAEEQGIYLSYSATSAYSAFIIYWSVGLAYLV
jgi:hypothetical protein